MLHNILTGIGAVLVAAGGTSAAALGSYNVDPNSVSTSGLSSGGFFAAQLGIAYSNVFKTGFGVFAGGPFDCARNQEYSQCMNNNSPSITTPINNMKSWSGGNIDNVANLKNRQIYMQVGTADTTVGPKVMAQLQSQLSQFGDSSKMSYVTNNGAAHVFPTDFDAAGDNSCGVATSPFISNCGYDGAGSVLKWMYGNLNARNGGTLTGSTVSFSQTGSYGAAGMDTTGYLYVPKACQDGSSVCKLHVAFHGCKQSYSNIGSKFIDNTGYNKWADTNNIIILYPQAIPDNSVHTVWTGTLLPNPNGCWDWVGWYGTNADYHGGVQLVAVVNMVNQIFKGYNGGTGTTPTTMSTVTTSTSTKTSSAAPATSTACAALYGQCGGATWTGPTCCTQGKCTAYSNQYAQCLLVT